MASGGWELKNWTGPCKSQLGTERRYRVRTGLVYSRSVVTLVRLQYCYYSVVQYSVWISINFEFVTLAACRVGPAWRLLGMERALGQLTVSSYQPSAIGTSFLSIGRSG